MSSEDAASASPLRRGNTFAAKRDKRKSGMHVVVEGGGDLVRLWLHEAMRVAADALAPPLRPRIAALLHKVTMAHLPPALVAEAEVIALRLDAMGDERRALATRGLTVAEPTMASLLGHERPKYQ